MFIYLFHFRLRHSIRHMFYGIDHACAFRFCSEGKTTKFQKLHIVLLELEELLLLFVSQMIKAIVHIMNMFNFFHSSNKREQKFGPDCNVKYL